jgi:hypothetical protein
MVSDHTTRRSPVQTVTTPPVGRPKPKTTPVHGMLQLQRAAGNAAVSRLVAGLEPLVISRAANGEGPTVQRADGAPAGWEAPDDLGFISDRGSAVAAINGVLLKEAASYQDVQAAGVVDQARLIVKRLQEEAARLGGQGALQADDVASLTGLGQAYTGFINNARDAVKNTFLSALRGLFNPPGMDAVNEQIGETMHALFLKPDDDKLKAIQESAERVKDIGDNAKWVADKALLVTSELETARAFHEISEAIEKFTGPIEKLIEIKKIGMGLWTLADGIAGKSEGLGDQVETAVDLAGLLGKPLISAVPLFGTYWNDFLVPLTKACVARLKRLEEQSDRINREHLMQLITWQPTPNGWRPLGPAPQLDDSARVYLASRPHGIAVFNYLYSVMEGEPAAISDEVEEVLLHQRDTLEKLSGDEMESEKRTWNPLTWFHRKPKDLGGWVATNIQTVWTAFYGGLAGLGT